ncbi:hypothetical protein ACHAPE_002549 [Trichoderma viride]
MSSLHAQSRRAHLAPIKTDTSSLPDISRRYSSRPSYSYGGITRSRLNSIGYAQDVMHSGPSPMRRNLNNASEMGAPYIWVPKQLCPTPVSEISPHTKVWPAVFEAHARRPRQMSMGHGDVFRQSTSGPLRVSYTRAASRRQSMYTYRARNRSIDVELQRNQQHRLSLWERGHKIFGLPGEADVFVKPLHLSRPLKEIRSWTEERSSASPLSQRVFVRAVIRSKSHGRIKRIGLKREFKLDELRATALDPLPCPQSKNFNRQVLLSRLQLSDEDLEAQSPVDLDMADDGDDDVVVKKEKTEMPPILEHPQPVPKATTVPMSLLYARSQLPALAAVMMSGEVRRGDMIQLAMPHPSEWPSTIAHVYTGERELLTEEVRENILYLGGKV